MKVNACSTASNVYFDFIEQEKLVFQLLRKFYNRVNAYSTLLPQVRWSLLERNLILESCSEALKMPAFAKAGTIINLQTCVNNFLDHFQDSSVDISPRQ
jgi:hypothetical protein